MKSFDDERYRNLKRYKREEQDPQQEESDPQWKKIDKMLEATSAIVDCFNQFEKKIEAHDRVMKQFEPLN